MALGNGPDPQSYSYRIVPNNTATRVIGVAVTARRAAGERPFFSPGMR